MHLLFCFDDIVQSFVFLLLFSCNYDFLRARKFSFYFMLAIYKNIARSDADQVWTLSDNHNLNSNFVLECKLRKYFVPIISCFSKIS